MPELKNDITLELGHTERRLEGHVAYNAKLFRRESIDRFALHLMNILDAVLTDGSTLICDLEMLSEAERRQLLWEWNDTLADYPGHSCGHHLFENQVIRSPEACALVCEDERLTYRELNERANRLARHLRTLGVGPDGLVAILLERSVDLLVAILGTLKAGGAYVPLDPLTPTERLSFILGDTQAPVLLTTQALLETLPRCEARIVCLDAQANEIALHSRENPNIEMSSANLAYVIYTSGSTGQPKGTMLTHRGLSNLAETLRRTFGAHTGTRVLQFASSSFDASVAESFMALTSGATLCLGIGSGLMAGSALIELLREQSINIVTLPPTLLAVLPEENLPELQIIVAAGEDCSSDIVARWLPGRKFINAYGPTETTVCASLHECSGTYLEGPPIGRPITNTQIYILDPQLRLVPVGVAGELHVGGDCLGRGYLGRPALTAEKFTPNRFSGQAGARLYKTGDLGRFLPNGEIEFMGRLDHQVKLRGYRIETGEIEVVLGGYAGVLDALVLMREDVPGDKRLVAYLVVDGETVIASGELRKFLQQKLPDYMIPSAFVVLPDWPLTINGKVDRSALPPPDRGGNESEQVFIPARSLIEEILVAIWAEVLGIEQVGIDDNFFELGGHSLLATQVLSRVREVFHVELPLRTLFEEPTVAKWALCVAKLQRADQSSKGPTIRPTSRDEILPVSFAQQRLWFLDRLSPDSSAYNISNALRLHGPLNSSILEQTLSEIMKRHEVLRTNFLVRDDRPVQIISPTAPVRIPSIDLSELPEEEREAVARRLATEESRRTFDLTGDQLLRVKLLRLRPDDHVVLVTMHHIVSDGWSMGLLVGEVSALYDAFSQGRPSPLAELSIQYADYAAWQREWLQGEVLEGQLRFWRELLAQAPPSLDLPTDRPRPRVQTFRGAHLTFSLTAKLSQELEVLSRQHQATLFMTLLAAFQILLSRYSGAGRTWWWGRRSPIGSMGRRKG